MVQGELWDGAERPAREPVRAADSRRMLADTPPPDAPAPEAESAPAEAESFQLSSETPSAEGRVTVRRHGGGGPAMMDVKKFLRLSGSLSDSGDAKSWFVLPGSPSAGSSQRLRGLFSSRGARAVSAAPDEGRVRRTH